jgi:hypothetical protein
MIFPISSHWKLPFKKSSGISEQCVISGQAFMRVRVAAISRMREKDVKLLLELPEALKRRPWDSERATN